MNAPSDGELAIDDAEWSAFVAGRPEATPFHHPSWAQALAECYGFRAFALVARGPDGAIAAGLPVVEVRRLRTRRWVSLPFTDVCEPLGGEPDRAALVAALDRRAREGGVRDLEVRGRVPPDAGALEPYTRGVVHVLDLEPGWESVRRSFGSQARRGLERSQRDGVVVRRGTARDDLLSTFYGLHLTTRRRQGVPIQPKRFFSVLWERVLEPGLGFVLVAEDRGELVAAAVFLAWNRRLVYKFGASDPRRLKSRPNHAIFGDAIRGACDEGMATLDFGRTDEQNEGLRAFKAGWGSVEQQLVYSTWRPPTHSVDVPAQVLGAVIRRSPEWVCRVAGERLYRYTA